MRPSRTLISLIAALSLASACLLSCDESETGNAQYDVLDPIAIPPDFTDHVQETISLDLESWMGRLADTTRVCKVSIPGTHDALTGMGFYQKGIGTIFNLTGTSQIAPLRTQLKSGLRFFDIRPVVSTDTILHEKVLRCTHGISELRVTFKEAIDQLQDFLKAHPTEFVIVKLQHDNGYEDQMKWLPMMEEFMTQECYRELFASWKPDVRVSELRGKILFINRVLHYEMRGAYCEWPDEDPDVTETIDYEAERSRTLLSADGLLSTRFYVQDYYKTTKPLRLQTKKEAVTRMLDSAREIPFEENTWVVNHCSAYTEASPLGYVTNAETIHPAVIENLKSNPVGTVGIIAMDFSCYDNVRCIINGGTPYTSIYLYDKKPMSQSMTNLIIRTNFPDL